MRDYPPDRDRLCRICVTWISTDADGAELEHVCVPRAGQCRNEYRGDGGPRLGQRIVACTLARGHEGEHAETDTGHTWPAEVHTVHPPVTEDGITMIAEEHEFPAGRMERRVQQIMAASTATATGTGTTGIVEPPAQRLHAAAQRPRVLAHAATTGPWTVAPVVYGPPDAGWGEPADFEIHAGNRSVVTHQTHEGGGIDHEPDASLIAAMHPGVAHAIADLLEAEAVTWESAETAADQINAEWKPDWHVEPPVDPEKLAGAGAKLALAVADLVLAGDADDHA